MEYLKLGSSDLKVSRIGFGCMSLKGTATDDEQLITKALEVGINYFDTADLYDKGDNERFVGGLLKPSRANIILATKVGNQWRPDGSGWDWNPTKAYILQAADASLKRLQTDYIDLYQLHGGTMDDPIDETIEAFEILKAQGKIRYYGISSIRPKVIQEYVKRSGIASVMTQYSLLDRRQEGSMLDLLLENKIAVLARGSLAQGLLVDKPAKAYLDFSNENVSKISEAVASISVNRSKTQTALKFVLQHPAVTSAVTGIRTMEQLLDIIGVNEVSNLSPKELSVLQQACL